ncbi:MAG: type II secretion system protein N [Brevundimonas sp.]|uniref:type II secretion system protein N n=1 Tax=Brevundimonas sp. TaxID=1871086 RepID=UPI0030039E35
MRRTVPPLPDALPIRRGVEITLGLGLAAVLIGGGASAFLSTGAQPRPADTVRPLTDPAVFARFDPFFRQGQGPAVLDLSAEGWLLFGTRTGVSGTAILQGPDGTQAAYGIGDTVAPDLVLASVGRDHVLLSRSGRSIRLEFADISIPAPPPPPGGATVGLSGDAATAAAEMGLVAPEADPFVAGLRPLSSGGEVQGYVWRRGAQIPALSAVGLREGDVITAVDGEPFTRDERLWELGQAVAGSAPVTLTVRRGGQTLSVTIDPPSE